jgi:hypothetical protein
VADSSETKLDTKSFNHAARLADIQDFGHYPVRAGQAVHAVENFETRYNKIDQPEKVK